jgi:uncharacterized hydrophobic protein (TIGR00271 family)
VTLVHLRVVCPRELAGPALDVLAATPGVIAPARATAGAAAPDLDVVQADLARESVNAVLDRLTGLGVTDRGLVTVDPVAAAIGTLAERADAEAPGEPDDALIWDELLARTGGDSRLSAVFVAFMILATVLAGIGVVTDSPITVVGAMVVGPEFGPLAGLAVALVRRRAVIARNAAAALLVGFPVAIVATALLTVAARAGGLVAPDDLLGRRETEFIYHFGWFSLITAVVAGIAGMLSLTSSRTAVLVGVFISVTTIPAAGNAAVAGVLGDWTEAWGSAAQLGINLLGIVSAGVLTLLVRNAFAGRRGGPTRRTPFRFRLTAR